MVPLRYSELLQNDGLVKAQTDQEIWVNKVIIRLGAKSDFAHEIAISVASNRKGVAHLHEIRLCIIVFYLDVLDTTLGIELPVGNCAQANALEAAFALCCRRRFSVSWPFCQQFLNFQDWCVLEATCQKILDIGGLNIRQSIFQFLKALKSFTMGGQRLHQSRLLLDRRQQQFEVSKALPVRAG
jgi:hypothetical protein